MKSSYILAAGGALLLSACAPMKFPALNQKPATQPQTQAATPYVQTAANQVATAAGYAQPTTPQTYSPQAYLPQQPVQPAQPVYTTDPVTGQPVLVQQPAVTPQPVYTTDPVTGQPVLVQQPAQPLYTTDPMTGQLVAVQPAAPVAPAYPTPAQPQPAGMGSVTGVSPDAAQPTAPQGPVQPQPVTGSTANYAVQMINGTTGRLFVEVFDDSDNVFPVGYMFAGANLSTPPSEARPIQGQLTVVIRDPDKPDAPELRRYKVTPPVNYTGKTIGITILPGGRYRASLDGEVYYASPDPKAAAPAAPGAPAAPTPAAAPAPTAPAPAPAPAAPEAPSTAPANIL
ncbi:MAG: hypothetical protein IJ503_02195 [Akkermansia sp.]|nr:hypothetical protein [Akkermansia sp.]